jgi:hypothetical protein
MAGFDRKLADHLTNIFFHQTVKLIPGGPKITISSVLTLQLFVPWFSRCRRSGQVLSTDRESARTNGYVWTQICQCLGRKVMYSEFHGFRTMLERADYFESILTTFEVSFIF